MVLSSDGKVLTNNHVISGATSISVTDIGNGKTYSAKVVGYDRTHDVAVLQLQNASGLQTTPLGDSSKVSVGDSVVGVGNAGGVGGTPSAAAGTVTALNQTITASDDGNGTSEQLSGLIQVNADIQPGDSGGSLVNSQGQVVGIDTAGSTATSYGSTGYDRLRDSDQRRAVAREPDLERPGLVHGAHRRHGLPGHPGFVRPVSDRFVAAVHHRCPGCGRRVGHSGGQRRSRGRGHDHLG